MVLFAKFNWASCILSAKSDNRSSGVSINICGTNREMGVCLGCALSLLRDPLGNTPVLFLICKVGVPAAITAQGSPE